METKKVKDLRHGDALLYDDHDGKTYRVVVVEVPQQMESTGETLLTLGRPKRRWFVCLPSEKVVTLASVAQAEADADGNDQYTPDEDTHP